MERENKENRRSKRIISYFGRELSIKEIAAIEGISYSRAYDKYARPTSQFAQLSGQMSIL